MRRGGELSIFSGLCGLSALFGLSALAGLSVLAGCERLWQSALTCSDDRSLATDESGSPYCPSFDLATPASDGRLLQPWPSTPVPVGLGTLGAPNNHPVSGLRISIPPAASTMRHLSVFFEGQSAYGSSLAGCGDATLSATPVTAAGLIYDATSADYGYLIYQSKQNPSTMTIEVNRAPVFPINGMSLAGATQPGFSSVDIDLKRKPIFSLINTQTATLHWALFDMMTPSYNTSVPIAAAPNSTSWHAAHADFNGDGYQDYVFSTLNAAGEMVLSGCLSSVSPCAAGGAKTLGNSNELLAIGDFLESPQLVRVVVSGTPQLILSKLVAVGDQTRPYDLSSASPAYRFPAGYEPKFLAAASGDGGQTISAFVAGTHAAKLLSTVFAFKLSATGELAAPVVELPLSGPPTAMALGGYPCLSKQQLVIAETIDENSVVRVYPAPSL